MIGCEILAIEFVLPAKCITNDDLSKEFPDYDFANFESKVGIKNRYVAGPEETALDLAVRACEKIFERFERSSIDYILYCTQSPEYILPTTACILQNRLGLNNSTGALDFNLGCSGYTYGLSLCKALINSGQAKSVLLITADTYSKYINKRDRSNRAIFGDAATATLVAASNKDKVGNFLFGTDGSGYDKLLIKNGGTKFKFAPNAAEINYGTDNIFTDNELYMNGPEIFNFTSEKVPNFTLEILKENKLGMNDISQFIFHQANAFMLNFLRKKLKIDPSKFYIDLEDGGNTVSSTIPIALKKYASNHHLQRVDDVVIVGFGVGLSWCGGVIKIDKAL